MNKGKILLSAGGLWLFLFLKTFFGNSRKTVLAVINRGTIKNKKYEKLRNESEGHLPVEFIVHRT